MKTQDLAEVQVRIWCDSKTNSIVWIEEDRAASYGKISVFRMVYAVFHYLAPECIIWVPVSLLKAVQDKKPVGLWLFFGAAIITCILLILSLNGII